MAQHLGRALSVIVRAHVRECIMHEDVGAFHAPSECHGLVSRGEIARQREARRLARSIVGTDPMRLAKRRVGSRVLYRALERLHGEIYAKLSPPWC